MGEISNPTSDDKKSTLEDIINGGEFQIMRKQKAKTRAVTLSSSGVITWNTPLKGALYKASGKSRTVSIRINPETNQMLLIAGEKVDDPNATIGEVSPSCSAIELLRNSEAKHNIKILPNGEKTSSYRYEESNGGLEVLQEDKESLAILLNLSKRKRNAFRGKVKTEGKDLTAEEKAGKA